MRGGLLQQNGYRLFAAGPVRLIFRPGTTFLLLGLLLLVCVSAAFVLPLGSYGVEKDAVWSAVFDPPAIPSEQLFIIRDIRLPRILMSLLCGSMLGLAGAAMQSITRNGLADPGLIGVKEGASVAVLAVILNFPTMSIFWRPMIGMIGGVTVAVLVAALARDLSRVRFILIGIGVSWFFSAGISFFVTTANIRDVQTALIWLAGSLHTSAWTTLGITAFWGGVGAAVLYLTSRAADIAMLGNQMGAGLGLRIRRLAVWRFIAPVLITAASVSAVGNVGFVGLIAPHLARFAVGSGQVPLLSASALFGAILVLVSDSIGRVAFAPTQLPAGVVMALIGVPFFLVLLWLRRDRL